MLSRMQTPSTEDVRTQSALLAEVYPADDAERDAALAVLIGTDAALVSSMTGRAVASGAPGDPVPDYLEPVAVRAISLRCEREAIRSIPKERRGSIKALRLRSFSAGPYSESYVRPEEASKRGLLDFEPEIHDMLWALCTDEKRDYWTGIWTGIFTPASATQEVAWGLTGMERNGGYAGRPLRY